MEKGTWGDVPDRPMTKGEQGMMEAVKQGLMNVPPHKMNFKTEFKQINLLRSLTLKYRCITWDDKGGMFVLVDPKAYETPDWLAKELADKAKAAAKKETVTASTGGSKQTYLCGNQNSHG